MPALSAKIRSSGFLLACCTNKIDKDVIDSCEDDLVNLLDSLVSRATTVLGQADKWEMDTLNCACAMVKLEHPVRFSSGLRRSAKNYLILNSPWVQLTTWKGVETPEWIIQRIQEWPGAHGDLPGLATYKFRSGDMEYSCFCRYARDWGGGGELSDTHCEARTILQGYESMLVSTPSNVVSICHCLHWTPPEKIAALLVSSKLVDSKAAAVTIFNDEVCTHAALACQ